MSKELSNELYQQIEQESGALTRKLSGSSEQDKDVQAGYFSGYQDGASKYALLLQSEQEKSKEAEEMMEKMANAIDQLLARFRPAAGDTWDKKALLVGKQRLTEYNIYKAKKDDSTHG